MGIGVSIFLIAVGAILAFAVNTAVSGVDITTVGFILVAVGALGLLWSLIVMGTGSARRRDAYVDDSPVVERRTVVHDRY